MKSLRQQKILEIIRNYDIDTQEALIEKLGEAGYTVTQTTISRDINQLKLVKAITASGSYKYIVPDVKRENNKTVMNSALTDAVIKIESAKNIVVVKTLSGMANAIAVCVDSLNHNEIVGSVAGDDTIIIVTKDDDIAEAMTVNLKTAFKFI
ncbi:MAG: arginine repressor [Ruminococcaceae bacterium]|nr:arginine repressor [Oscillospiraceae bacterium]